jgi:hypothetical protein
MAALRGRRVAGACFDVPERSGEDSWALPGSDRPPIVLSVVATSRNRHESKREMHISLNRGVNHSISENRQERDLIAGPIPARLNRRSCSSAPHSRRLARHYRIRRQLGRCNSCARRLPLTILIGSSFMTATVFILRRSIRRSPNSAPSVENTLPEPESKFAL